MIYLDFHAAAPVTDVAKRAMENFDGWANPSSVHRAGRESRRALENAREQVAASLGASSEQIVLTAGGTEACNLAILGMPETPTRIITSRTEHPAVGRSIEVWEERGAKVERLHPESGGAPSLDSLNTALAAGADLAVFQWANHETGALTPVAEFADRCHRVGVPLVIDATQAFGRIPINVAEMRGVHAVVVASHKMGGPAGAGALWIHPSWMVHSQMHGGGQERGRRAGTPDVRAAVGFGAACSVLVERLEAMPEVSRLKDQIESALEAAGGIINSQESPRIPSVCNASFRGWRGELLVMALDVEGLCVASGPACSAGIAEPSPTVLALYPDQPWRAESALRVSVGPETTDAEVGQAISIMRRVLARGT